MKAIFFDIDGTLVPIGHKGMLPSTVAALDAARGRGIKLFVNTGRPRYFIDNLGNYPFDGYVCMNGGQAIYEGRTVYKRPLEPSDVRRIIDVAEENRLSCAAFAADRVRLNFHNDRERQVSASIHVGFDEVGPLDDMKEEEIFQFTIYCTVEEEKLFTGLRNVIFPRWLDIFTDVDRADSSKASGMARVAELLGIPMSEVMAVGDGGNDLSMLQAAGVSVAMGNAVPEVQAAATFVSADAADDGIAVALRHFGLI
ncbi:MAG: Cof-type HAD-IIB family hydrolase [Bacteroidales bacterium]|nr:Cof-type HAD-IIB family hydrolase [Bacteroidales bacterium]